MAPVHRISGTYANAVDGQVKFDLKKASWIMGFLLLAIVFAPFTISAGTLCVFLCSTYFTLLIGHSAGMHRLMIHQSYDCKPWFEKMLIYVGVLVGMGGPSSIMKVHDIRDWAQRQSECHDFFAHRRGFWLDLWWQLTCRFEFQSAPKFTVEKAYANDLFYQWLDKTWAYHQIGLGLLLYACGGWPFVVWGVFVRVPFCIIGHWTITHFCHNPGAGQWRVTGASVQASNLPWLGFITYGECWHNNHHAFPESAQIGLEPGQSDPAWQFICLMKKVGLVTRIGLPRSEQDRDDLYQINSSW